LNGSRRKPTASCAWTSWTAWTGEPDAGVEPDALPSNRRTPFTDAEYRGSKVAPEVLGFWRPDALSDAPTPVRREEVAPEHLEPRPDLALVAHERTDRRSHVLELPHGLQRRQRLREAAVRPEPIETFESPVQDAWKLGRDPGLER
jgi:hypothetical protein